MVRKIVGSLIYVGIGRLEVTQIQRLFDPSSEIPKMGVPSAPAEGLVLWDVDYGFPFEVDEYAVKKLQQYLVEKMTSLVIRKTILNRFVQPMNKGSAQQQSSG
jgi:tRNA U38,U39,U40 pseudouridine synthase TruA